MGFIDNFTDMMPHTVVIHTKGQYTKAGDVLYGPDMTVKGYVEGKAHRVIDADGTEVISSAVFYSYTYLGELEPEATVDLPTGFFPRNSLKVIKVVPLSDESPVAWKQGSVLYLK